LTNDDGEIVQIVQFHTQVSSDLVQINPEVGFVCQLDGQTEILSIERPFVTSAWSTGEVNTSSIEVSEAGDYSVTIIDEFGCEAIGTSEVVDLGINEDEIEDYLVANGFTCIPVRLVDFPTVNRPDSPIRSTTTTNSFEDLVIVDYGEGEVNLTSEVENFILSLNDHGLSSQAFLTINADFCSSVFADTEEEYNISGNENFLSLWYHLVDTPDSDNDCLYIKARYFADEDTNLSIPEEPSEPEITDCGLAERRNTLLMDHRRAIEMLDLAIDKLEVYDGTSPTEVRYALDEFFPDYADLIELDDGNRLRKWLKTARFFMYHYAEYRCSSTVDPSEFCIYSPLGPAAYTYRNFLLGEIITVCDPGYFDQTDVFRSETLIHEITHAFIFTDDVHYYRTHLPPQPLDYSIHDALNNADSYSRFVRNVWLHDSGEEFPIGPLTSLIYHEYSQCPSAFSLEEDRLVISQEPESVKSLKHDGQFPGGFNATIYSGNGTQFVAVPSSYGLPFEYIGMADAERIFNEGTPIDEFDFVLTPMLIAKKEGVLCLLRFEFPSHSDNSCDNLQAGSVRFYYKRSH